jgi:hypothetical protein
VADIDQNQRQIEFEKINHSGASVFEMPQNRFEKDTSHFIQKQLSKQKDRNPNGIYGGGEDYSHIDDLDLSSYPVSTVKPATTNLLQVEKNIHMFKDQLP